MKDIEKRPGPTFFVCEIPHDGDLMQYVNVKEGGSPQSKELTRGPPS